MDTNVNYTIVGLFVITLIAAITLSIIWLSSGFSFEQYKMYEVDMTESVSGLSVDSPVEFNGVDVGSVKSVEIDHTNPKLVKLLLDVKSETPISMGTVATLASKGVTGITFISLKDKGENPAPLKKQKDQKYPVIATAPSLFLRLDQALSRASENLHKVTEDIGALLTQENLESIRLTLHNMQRITANMAENNKQIDAILRNSARISAQLNPLIQSSTNTMRILEVQTLPATYRMISNLDATTRSLAEAAAEIKDNPSIIIRGVNRNNYGPGEQR